MPRVVTQRSDTLPALAEVFREHGYEGASLALLTKATGLGKGSLYHFFPGGKEEMAAAVLQHIDAWFEANVFSTLRRPDDTDAAIAQMFKAVDTYFLSGRRVCLAGAVALSDSRNRFGEAVGSYFQAWIDALACTLMRSGRKKQEALLLAQHTVAGIQGAIVLARALDDTAVFSHTLDWLETQIRQPSAGQAACQTGPQTQ